MMSELVLKFERSDDIAAGDVGFPDGADIGLIQLVVRSSSAQEDVLLAVRWNLQELICWFKRNSNAIANEQLPEFITWNGSISDSIDHFYDAVDIDQDEQIDRVFEYRQRHELCFALRGAEVPSIYIGRGKSGDEISGEVDGKRFSLLVDLEKFFSSLEEKF
jgi:hypothetical protein